MAKDDEYNVVDAKRYKINYDGDKIYVIISQEAKEIFISSVQDQQPKTAAIYDSLTRMISMSWQNNPTDSIKGIIDQLKKSSRSKFDLPGMLAELLSN